MTKDWKKSLGPRVGATPILLWCEEVKKVVLEECVMGKESFCLLFLFSGLVWGKPEQSGNFKEGQERRPV